MDEREKDIRACRDVLGYTIYHYDKGHPNYYALMDAQWIPALPDLRDYHSSECATEAEAWALCPTGDDLVRLLEDEIERRGLQGRYTDFLYEIANPDELQESAPVLDLWRLLRVTPSQRRDAALKAVGAL